MNFFFVGVWQVVNKVGQIYILRRLTHLFIGNPISAKPNITFDRSGKQKCVLEDDAKPSPEITQRHVLDIDAVNPNRSALNIVKTQQ